MRRTLETDRGLLRPMVEMFAEHKKIDYEQAHGHLSQLRLWEDARVSDRPELTEAQMNDGGGETPDLDEHELARSMRGTA